MSGSTGERVAVVTASARSLPPLTYSIDEDMVANMTCTCPPSRSTSAGPAPRYGTCTTADSVYRLTWRLPLAGLVAFSHLQFSQIRCRQPYSIVRKIPYLITSLGAPGARSGHRGLYIPAANDPRYVRYRLASDHDPVAYFTGGRPMPGLPEFEYEWDDHVYRFASAEHREMFRA